MQILLTHKKPILAKYSTTKTRLLLLEQHHFLKDTKHCCVPPYPKHNLI